MLYKWSRIPALLKCVFVIYGQESNIKELWEPVLTEQTAWNVIKNISILSCTKALINVYLSGIGSSSSVFRFDVNH